MIDLFESIVADCQLFSLFAASVYEIYSYSGHFNSSTNLTDYWDEFVRLANKTSDISISGLQPATESFLVRLDHDESTLTQASMIIRFVVVAVDEAGNRSPPSNVLSVSLQPVTVGVSSGKVLRLSVMCFFVCAVVKLFS